MSETVPPDANPPPPPPADSGSNSARVFIAAMILFVVGLTLRAYLVDGPRGMREAYGLIMLIGIPTLIGVVVGAMRPLDPVWATIKVTLVLLLCVAPLFGEGFICLLFLAPFVLILSMIGAALSGWLVRAERKKTTMMLGVLAIVGPPLASDPPETDEVIIADSIDVDAPPDEVWSAIDRVFIDFDRPLPGPFRWGFPKPTRLIGRGSSVGDVRRVEFDNGTVVATVTTSERPRQFVLRLTLENPGREFFDHWIRLEDSTFDFIPLENGRTRLVHTTRYHRLLAPDRIIAPIELWGGHLMQEYLLHSWAEAAERSRPVSTWVQR